MSNSSAEDWATGVAVVDRLLNNEFQGLSEDPCILVQRATCNVLICGGPTECFSTAMPAHIPENPDEDDLLPIDVLYGIYIAAERRIEIFVNRIRQDAGIFGAHPKELIEIVRLHEHAHAVIHLGVRGDKVESEFCKFDSRGLTDWKKLIDDRTEWFTGFPDGLHELLAQSLTYATICSLGSIEKSTRLRRVFCALEEKQPEHYKLSPEVKDAIEKSKCLNWPLVLDAARGAVDCHRKVDFTLADGLDALIRLYKAT
ncbi:MAG: hypothetical protein K8F90_03335 [Hyphomicrobiales bacterium]|nr:hypothetical protein [Hyphomicrobiales bacterium]